jgi:hypothetical protein
VASNSCLEELELGSQILIRPGVSSTMAMRLSGASPRIQTPFLAEHIDEIARFFAAALSFRPAAGRSAAVGVEQAATGIGVDLDQPAGQPRSR